MQKSRIYAHSITMLFIAMSGSAHAEINPSDLILVTPKTNPSCVEYFTYQHKMYCSTKPLEKGTASAVNIEDEKQNVKFDDRYWHAAWSKQTPAITTIEYVPLNDDINNWSELVTTQFIPGAHEKVTPSEYANIIIDNLKESGFKPIIKFIEGTPDQVIFEFRIAEPANLQQDELQIVRKGKDGLYCIHYVMKKSDMGQANRDKWVALLKQSSIK